MEKRTLLSAVVLIVVGVFSSTVLAGGPLGPPGATLPQGSWTVDAGYFYEDMDLHGMAWDSNLVRESDINDNDPNIWEWSDWNDPNKKGDSYTGTSLIIKDFKTNTWLTSFEYGLWENCTIYIRAGMVDAEADITAKSWEYLGEDEGYGWSGGDALDAEFDYGFAWQIGSGFTFYRSGPWTFGGRMQFGMANPDEYSWSETDEFEDLYVEDYGVYIEGYESWRGNIDLDWWQAMAYLGGTYQLNDALQVYCGGGWQTLHGTFEYSGTDTSKMTGYKFSLGEDYTPLDDAVPLEQESHGASCKIKHASAIAVFGLGFEPTDNVHVGGEVLIGEAGKWGVGITGAFAVP
jgi:hypothetical protein